MQELERIAINKYGIPSMLLMENAGRRMAEEVIKRAQRLRLKNPAVSIYCGQGNNGGDGLVCARYLFANGVNTRVFVIGDSSSIKGDPAVHLNILQKMKMATTTIKNRKDLRRLKKVPKTDIIVDAIFGIGFKGRAGGLYKEAIEFIGRICAYTFSVDVPSGLDATTGQVKGPCIRADETITMSLPKTGFYRKDGPEYAGRVKVVEIGLPATVLKMA